MDRQPIRIRAGTLARFVSCAASLLAGAFLMACTSANSASPTSQVAVTLPDFSHFRSSSVGAESVENSAATTFVLDRVMINVSGPGATTPVFSVWDSSQSGSSAAAPSSFNLTVPQGNGYLVQVLAVLQPSSSNGGGAMVFLYGDSAANLTSATVPVNISLAQIGASSATSAQGAIAGRYLTAAGFGPTGEVNIEYTPPGKPPMIVTQAEIFGGWFQWVAFETINFSYVMADGTPLISNFNLDSRALLAGGPANMLVSVPIHYQQNNQSYQLSSPWIFQLGYFGPGAAGNLMCYDSTAGDNMTQIYSDAGGDPVVWAGAGPSGLQAGVVAGGLGAANANCQAVAGGTAPLTNWMAFNQIAMGNNNNNPLAFQGPFMLFPPTGNGSGNALNVTPAGSNLNLSWQYMPGTTGPNLVSAVGLFVRDLPTAPTNYGNQDFQVDNGVACNRLTDPSFLTQPFTFVGNVGLQNGGTGLQSYSLSGYSLSDFFSGKLQFILCPYSSVKSVYFTSAAAYTGQGGNQNPQVAIAGEPSVISSTCSPFTLSYTMNGYAVNAPSGTVVNLSSSGAANGTNLGFYQDATCNTALGSSTVNGMTSFAFAFPAGASTATVYYEDANNMAGSSTRSLNASVQGQNSFSSGYQIGVGTTSGSGYTFSITYSSILLQGQCIAFNVGLQGSGGALMNNAARTVTLTDNSGAGSFYADPLCASTIPGGAVNYAGTEFFKTVYFKSTASAGNYTITPSSSGFSGVGQTYTLDSPAVTSASINVQPMNGSNSLYLASGSCVAVNLATYALHGESTSVTSTTSAALSSSSPGLTFSSSSNCSNPSQTFSVSLNPQYGSYSSTFYMLMNETYGYAYTPSISIASLGINNSSTFYIQPDSIQFNATSLPSGNQLMQGYCQPITVGPAWGGSAFPGGLPAPISLNLSVSGMGGTYSDSSCNFSYSTINLPTGTNTSTFYVQATSGSAISLKVTGQGVTTPSLTQSLTSSGLTPSVTITVNGGSSVPYNTCGPVVFALPSVVTDPAGATVNLSTSSGTNLASNFYYYTNASSCSALSGPQSSAVIPQGNSSVTMYVKLNSIPSITGPQFNATFPSIDVGPGTTLSGSHQMSSCVISSYCSP